MGGVEVMRDVELGIDASWLTMSPSGAGDDMVKRTRLSKFYEAMLGENTLAVNARGKWRSNSIQRAERIDAERNVGRAHGVFRYEYLRMLSIRPGTKGESGSAGGG
jgi:hypothetical protein